jgi:hypothetical protein
MRTLLHRSSPACSAAEARDKHPPRRPARLAVEQAVAAAGAIKHVTARMSTRLAARARSYFLEINGIDTGPLPELAACNAMICVTNRVVRGRLRDPQSRQSE